MKIWSTVLDEEKPEVSIQGIKKLQPLDSQQIPMARIQQNMELKESKVKKISK